WEITPEKFLNAEELSRLLIRADELRTLGVARKRPQLVRDWMILNLFVMTGVRRREACELKCVDFHVFGGNSYLVVRRGKGGTDDKPKTRHVHLPKGFAADVRWYLKWKAERGEIRDEDAHFFITERTPKYTPSGIYKRVKKYLPDHRVHDLRHTNATALYEATNCLRLVQKQLGHSSITTTQVYADVSVEQSVTGMTAMEKLVNGLKRKAVKATAYAAG
ncbi:tyrosine-type recombinase/integrase, partial [Verrucomicrobiota bacterium]